MPFRRLAALALMAAVVLPATATAQRRGPRGGNAPRFELSPIAGYNLTSSISLTNQLLDLSDALSLGGTLGFRSPGGQLIELGYSYMNADLRGTKRLAGQPDTTYGPVNQHVVMVGGVNEFGRGTARPFLGGSLGLAIWSPDITGADDVTRFSLAATVGVKVMSASERIGLRIQSRFLFHTLTSSFGVICGPAGCGGTYAGSGMFQWEPSAGLVIGF